MSPMICFALATIPMPLSSRWTRLYPYLRLLFSNASRVFCQIFVGRFGVSFSPFERLFLGRFGFGQSCGLSVIA